VWAHFEDDVAAIAAVTAVWPSLWVELSAEEADAAIAAISGARVNSDVVDKRGRAQ